MKGMSTMSQLKNMPKLELQKMLGEERERLWSLKTELAAGKVKNVKEMKKVKKNIARTLTLLRQISTE